MREARNYYQRSLDAWVALRDSGALAPADAGKIDEVTRELAACDTALAQL